ncbi:hypothetical protein FHL15_005386 [Xylaria flabelliformis]|uniref:GA4 desaturase n=1 Tax=Xylaria flabelliformis TaxID=2512241 RepID=A0A553I0I1_9PEZI|nr:hypothetical protein FHL15_005386 [Xylaria flabelliformis]
MAATVETSMNYYLDPSKGGTETYSFGTVGVLRRKFDTQAIHVNDLRGLESEFDIHTHAFQPCKWKPSTESLNSSDIIKVVYPEAEEFVKTITHATRVHCFSHLIRQNTVEDNVEALKKLEASRGKANISDKEGFGKTVPARQAHIDQSGKGARTLLYENLPTEAEKLSKTRWGTVNLWRPIRTVRRDPLCFCDGRTISEEDLVPIDAVPPPKGTSSFYESISKGDGFQTLEVRASPNHKWYYLAEMQPDEALIFKCYDTKNTSNSRCCHASFKLPGTANSAPRESMEMRFFVFYENEPLQGF